MTKVTNETQVTETADVQPKAKPKYLAQREKRQRFSFGNTWLNAVLAGVVTDKEKLVAHGVHVKAGEKAELESLDFEVLLKRVQDAIFAQEYVRPAEAEVTAATEVTEDTTVEA